MLIVAIKLKEGAAAEGWKIAGWVWPRKRDFFVSRYLVNYLKWLNRFFNRMMCCLEFLKSKSIFCSKGASGNKKDRR